MTTQHTSSMTQAELLAIVEQLRADNAALKASVPQAKTGIKLSEKNAISVYGLGRFPVSLYRGQWLKLFSKIEEIKAFMEANKEHLDAVEASRTQG